ncbi:hypothetical protein Btru_031961 [Bulinus truncatus]|nr:hypothetical protein Btru_031961 [Bulinus truncatus]
MGHALYADSCACLDALYADSCACLGALYADSCACLDALYADSCACLDALYADICACLGALYLGIYELYLETKFPEEVNHIAVGCPQSSKRKKKWTDFKPANLLPLGRIKPAC